MLATNLPYLWSNSSWSHTCDSQAGRFVAAVVEFSAITSEGWFVVLIVDLLTSLTNPFKDYRANMRNYHLCVWALGIGVSTSMFSTQCFDELTDGVCWVAVTKGEWVSSPCIWGLYLGWLFIFYAYAAVQIIHARCNLMGFSGGACAP